jgi:NAD(P)H-dependent FMN reductase
MTNIIVLSSSLSATSRTRLMCAHAMQSLAAHNVQATLIDLAQHNILPYPRSKDDPAQQAASAAFNAAHAWVIATPVYNFGASGALLDFLHYALDNDLGRWKPFVLMAAQAGQRSTMSIDHIGRTLHYEVSAVQVGSCIMAVGDAAVNRATGVVADDLKQRIDTQLGVLVHYAHARAALPA